MKNYIGDSVYCELRDQNIILTTENGGFVPVSNTIILEPQVWKALGQFVARAESDPSLRGVQWWGYRHSNQTIQCKRWFGDHRDYTEDCEGNRFVLKVVEPFWAVNQHAAMLHLQEKLK